ncbi:hypothetical protein EP7_000685 [Isosphaeraceae bacterium EP7]
MLTFRRWRVTASLFALVTLGHGTTSPAQKIQVDRVVAAKLAEAEYLRARMTRVVAEVDVLVDTETRFKEDVERFRGEIALAKSEVARARERLRWSERFSKSTKLADQLALEKAKFTLEQSMTKLEVLRKYTQKNRIKEREAEIEKAKGDDNAKKEVFDQARSRLDERNLPLPTSDQPNDDEQ